MRYHAENNKAQAERVRQLQALHESWLAYRTADHGMHGERESGVESLPPSLPAARSFFQAKREGSGKSKEASADGRAGGGMGSRQRQIIEALSIDVSTAISDPPTVNECPWPNLPSVDERSGDFDSSANLPAHLQHLGGSIASRVTNRSGRGGLEEERASPRSVVSLRFASCAKEEES